MVFINVRELSKLIETAENRGGLEQKVAEFQEKHNIKILLEEYETLVDLAIKINKREKGKAHDNSKKSSTAEVFTYGELKLFSWTLFLYCFTRTLSLTQLGEDDFQFFSKIFKQKTQAFIEYEINCLIWSKDKYVREWDEQELQLFHHITSNKASEEWKTISFVLFCQSGGRFFRPFQQCRQRWINYSNPSVKRGDWTLQEDIELFTLVAQLGCRWALISRELKGTRSQHSIKNRYNSVVKSMRKQYKITCTTEVEQKVLKYLKFRMDRKAKSQDDSAELNLSSDSKLSRERSRDIVKIEETEHNQSSISNEPEPEAPIDTRAPLFQGIFDVNIAQGLEQEQPIENKILNIYVSDECSEEKQMKRTWEEEYEVIDGQISIGNAFEAGQNWWLNEDNNGRNIFPDADIQPIAVRETQELPVCSKIIGDDWLFDGQWDE